MDRRVKQSHVCAAVISESECRLEKLESESCAADAVEDREPGDVKDFVLVLEVLVGLVGKVEALDIIPDLERDGTDGHIVLVKIAKTGVGLELDNKIFDAFVHRVEDRRIDPRIFTVRQHRRLDKFR